MSCEFGAKLTKALGTFLRNLDLILLVNRDSGNTFKYVFLSNYLVAVRNIDPQSGNIGEGNLYISETEKRKYE